VHLQLLTNFTDILVTTEPKVTIEKFTHLIVRLKTASDLKSTVFGDEFQTLTTRSVQNFVTNTRSND